MLCVCAANPSCAILRLIAALFSQSICLALLFNVEDAGMSAQSADVSSSIRLHSQLIRSAQIGDLLAQISGGDAKSLPSAALTVQQPGPAAKRKADDDLRREVSKNRRGSMSTPTPKALQATRPTDKSATKQQTQPGSSQRPPAAAAEAKVSNRKGNGHATTKAPTPARPPVSSAVGGVAVPKPPPKKGSFAEIMARGQRAQAVMGQVGKIQHKKVERASIVKRHDGNEAQTAAVPKDVGRKVSRPTGYKGSAKLGQLNGHIGQSQSRGSRDGKGVGSRTATVAGKAALGKKSSVAPLEEKKPKPRMAAQATTGYAGTARPRTAQAVKKDTDPRGGALLNRSAHRPSMSSRRRYEDQYDEDMDDFIEYDDEEDDGPRYGYASDASSDMEAGMEELDHEERYAERIARKEDVEEERLERSLRMAKEERKKRAFEALRAGKQR